MARSVIRLRAACAASAITGSAWGANSAGTTTGTTGATRAATLRAVRPFAEAMSLTPREKGSSDQSEQDFQETHYTDSIGKKQRVSGLPTSFRHRCEPSPGRETFGTTSSLEYKRNGLQKWP